MIESTTYILCAFAVPTGSGAAFLISSTIIVIWAAVVENVAEYDIHLRTLAYLNKVMDSMLGSTCSIIYDSDSIEFMLFAQNWKLIVGCIRPLCRPHTERGLMDFVDECSVII